MSERRPAFAVTLFALAVHGANFIIQILLARLFGAGREVDAFLAATAVPQYIVTVLLSALPVVFIPVFASYAATGEIGEARKTARAVIEIFVAIMSVCALTGIVAASLLLRVVTPGLDAATHDTAVRLSWIVWPGVIASALTTLLTAMYHAERQFVRASIVPAVGALLNVALIIGLARFFGIYAVAIGSTVSLILQAALLLPALHKSVATPWSHPGVRQVLALLWPMLVAGFFFRANLVIERTLASRFNAGAIAHLTYAARLAALVSFLCSTGLATVLFPTFAEQSASGDREALRASMIRGLRLMWVITAPAIAIGIPLSAAIVSVILQHGHFSAADTAATSHLLQIYFLSIIATALAMITGRVIYAIKGMRVVAAVGGIEAALYIAYTILLTRRFGLTGVAWGFVIYVSLSITWQLIYVGMKIGWRDWTIALRMILTTVAAAAGGAAAFAVTQRIAQPLAQLVVAGACGLIVYVILLAVINRDDLRFSTT